MGKYAIVQQVGSVNEEGESTGSGWGLATAVPLDEATVRNLQRLGGRLEDGDAAAVLLARRELSKMHPSDRANKQKADVWFAKSVSVWDPQAGEGTT